MAAREVVIDACCVINLLATGREVEIMRALGWRLLDTPYTSGEPTSVWSRTDDLGRRVREPAFTAMLRSSGLLVTRALDTEALCDAFLLAGERLREADASCVALAGVLGLLLATDDRKQQVVARDLFPGIGVVSTLDILHDGGLALGWDDDQLAGIAAKLRWRGNFAAPKQHPRSAWYAELLRRAGVEG